jgi:hypothetical protein
LSRAPPGDLAEVGEAPESDEKLSGQGDDADLAQSWAAGGETPVVPASQLASGLLAQPDPGQVDGDAADATVAGSADASLAGAVAALIGRRGKANPATDLPAVAETAPGDLACRDFGSNLGDATKTHQSAGDLCSPVSSLTDASVTSGFQIQQLAMEEAVAGHLRLQTRSQPRGQRRTVPDADGPQRGQHPSTAAPEGPALAREQALHAVDQASLLLLQSANLALEMSGILLLGCGDVDDTPARMPRATLAAPR